MEEYEGTRGLKIYVHSLRGEYNNARNKCSMSSPKDEASGIQLKDELSISNF